MGWNAIAREQNRSGVLNVITGTRMLTYLSWRSTTPRWRQARSGPWRASLTGRSGRRRLGGRALCLLPAPSRLLRVPGACSGAGPRWPGERHTDFAGGEAIGREIAPAVLASAATDGLTPSNTGVVVAVCPGCWFSAPGLVPVFPRLGEMQPFFLTSGSQFRPGPPPEFGTPDFLAALAEVRHFSDTRTPEQDAAAKFWAAPNGFLVIPTYNYQIANEQIVKFHLNELRAAHVFTLMGMASMDAFLACHDAKYTYWLIRPSQADHGITLGVPLPNHPSYPSNHSCITGAAMARRWRSWLTSFPATRSG